MPNLTTIPAIFVALFFAAPFLTPYTIYPWPIQDYLAPAWGVSMACAFFYANKKLLLPAWTLAVFLFLLLFYFFQSQASDYSFYGGTLIAIFAAALTGLHLNQHSIRLVLKIFTVACIVYLLVAWIVWLGLTGGAALHIYKIIGLSTLPTIKPNGPFLTGNILAIISVCGWVAAYWLYNDEKKSVWLWSSIILWAGVISGLSRSAWLAHGIIIIALLIRDRSQFFRLTATGLAALLLGNLIVEYGTGGLTIGQRFDPTAASGMAGRTVLWRAALEMWYGNILTGVGAGQFDAHYFDYQLIALQHLGPDAVGLGATDSAHNAPLHLVAEHGLVGLFIALGLTLLIAVMLWKMFTKMNHLRWAPLLIVSLLWFQGMFNITMTTAYPIIYFAFFLGIALRPFLRGQPRIQVNGPMAALLSGFVAVVLFIGAFNQTDNWQNFAAWGTESDPQRKKELAEQLLRERSMLPHMVETAVYAHMHDATKLRAMIPLRPHILEALKVQQRPNLYRALFIIDVLEGNLKRACQTGKYIMGQHFHDEKNQQAYELACQGKSPTHFIPPK